jgi:hypothetical protein
MRSSSAFTRSLSLTRLYLPAVAKDLADMQPDVVLQGIASVHIVHGTTIARRTLSRQVLCAETDRRTAGREHRQIVPLRV